jgi:hypothetical protein
LQVLVGRKLVDAGEQSVVVTGRVKKLVWKFCGEVCASGCVPKHNTKTDPSHDWPQLVAQQKLSEAIRTQHRAA